MRRGRFTKSALEWGNICAQEGGREGVNLKSLLSGLLTSLSL